MPRKRLSKLRCPICKKPATAGSPDFPFCSDRCRSIDLGKWATGQYVVSSPATDAEDEIQVSTPEEDEQ